MSLKKSEKKNLSLGCMIACLEQKITYDRDIEEYLHHESNIKTFNFLQTLHEQFDSTQSAVSLTIPKGSCTQENHFLKDNSRFFVHHFFFYKDGKTHKKLKQKIMKHLNNCYWCFCEYSSFFRDYFYTLESFEKTPRAK